MNENLHYKKIIILYINNSLIIINEKYFNLPQNKKYNFFQNYLHSLIWLLFKNTQI